MGLDMYAEQILDHYNSPRNYGELKDADIKSRDVNPLCGDGFEFFIKTEKGKIIDVSFKGDGCAISTASASMLSEFIKGKSLKEVEGITQKDVTDLLGISVSPARIKCALLPAEIIKSGIKNSQS